MDKEFKRINDWYLGQKFEGAAAENEIIESCKQIGGAYAFMEGAIVSMGDNIR